MQAILERLAASGANAGNTATSTDGLGRPARLDSALESIGLEPVTEWLHSRARVIRSAMASAAERCNATRHRVVCSPWRSGGWLWRRPLFCGHKIRARARVFYAIRNERLKAQLIGRVVAAVHLFHDAGPCLW